MKKIALIDCNNFFVSCEELKNPELSGKAVCVLSNNDGCVVSRSNEAKKLGIRMGMPYFMAKREFPNAIYLSSDIGYYHNIAVRIREVFYEYSPHVEVYSIDEAFLDLTGLDKIFNLSYFELISQIRNDIKTRVGIPVSIGLAPSKTLAKLAVEKAKKGDFLREITPDNLIDEITNVEIEMIWGIGRRTASKLRSYGIFYVNDLIERGDDFYKKNFGKVGLELKYELKGFSVIKDVSSEEKPKSLQRTSSFPKFSNNKDYIRQSLLKHLHNTCVKLRSLNLATKNIFVMLRTKDFRMQVNNEFLQDALNSEFLLSKIVDSLFEKMYQDGILYRSSGIYVAGFEDLSIKQLGLFRKEDNIKSDKIAQVFDRLEKKFDRGIVTLGYIHPNQNKKSF